MTIVSKVCSSGNYFHSNGISIELGANYYFLALVMSKGANYWHPDYLEYYSQFPAHKTVSVDGQSTYNRLCGYNPYALDNYFTQIGESIKNIEKVIFSEVSLIEPRTLSDTQR